MKKLEERLEEALIKAATHNCSNCGEALTVDDALEAALSVLPKWQTIDKLPEEYKDGREIILGRLDYVDTGYWDAGGWAIYPNDSSPETQYCVRFDPAPTHWQELPEGPGE